MSQPLKNVQWAEWQIKITIFFLFADIGPRSFSVWLPLLQWRRRASFYGYRLVLVLPHGHQTSRLNLGSIPGRQLEDWRRVGVYGRRPVVRHFYRHRLVQIDRTLRKIRRYWRHHHIHQNQRRRLLCPGIQRHPGAFVQLICFLISFLFIANQLI